MASIGKRVGHRQQAEQQQQDEATAKGIELLAHTQSAIRIRWDGKCRTSAHTHVDLPGGLLLVYLRSTR